MRKWIPVALIVLAVLWYVLNGVGSAMALAEATGRPILALTSADARIPVTPPGGTPADGEAQAFGGKGIHFGYSFVFRLPDGSSVTCNHRFRFVSCDGGWTPERASQ
jgi:hypothetical protein